MGSVMLPFILSLLISIVASDSPSKYTTEQVHRSPPPLVLATPPSPPSGRFYSSPSPPPAPSTAPSYPFSSPPPLFKKPHRHPQQESPPNKQPHKYSKQPSAPSPPAARPAVPYRSFISPPPSSKKSYNLHDVKLPPAASPGENQVGDKLNHNYPWPRNYIPVVRCCSYYCCSSYCCR